MPADTSILMGYRPPQIEMPDVQNARAAQAMNVQQQNMLGQAQLMEVVRANQQKNAMRKILSEAPEGAPTSEINRLIERSLISGGDIAGLMAHRKALAEAEAAQAKIGKEKAQTDLAGTQNKAAKLKLFTNQIDILAQNPNDQAIQQWTKLSIENGLMDEAAAKTGLAELLMLPLNQRREKLLQLGLTAKDALARTEPKYEFVDIGGKKVRVQTNPNAPGFDATQNELVKTATIGELEIKRSNLEREKINRSELNIKNAELKLKQEKELREKDPAFQQAISRAKATGEAIAKGDVAAVQALPKILDRANRSINLIDEMVGKQEVRDKNGKIIQAATAPHPGFNSAVGFGLGERFLPGSPASDFQSRFEEIKGGAFLEAFESLKGAGAISEKEGEKGTTAITRMSLAQSEKEFMAAARDFQDVVRKGAANAQNRASQAGATPNVDALVDKYKTK
jgi:hypothetical protein